MCDGADGGSLPRQKRRHGGSHSASRDVQAVYRKLTEVVENLALLLETQLLTDTTVLQVHHPVPSLSPTTFPISPQDLISRYLPFLCGECEFSSVEFTASGQSCKSFTCHFPFLIFLWMDLQIFSRYEKHRELILEDIFASLARLPTTKRNLRSFKCVSYYFTASTCAGCTMYHFRLSNGSSVQMVTALILQLVQCIVALPEVPSPQPRSDTPPGGTAEGSKVCSKQLVPCD